MITGVYSDLREAMRRSRFWLLFGLHDAGAQFQRTSIGGLFHSLNVFLRVVVVYYIFREGFGGNDPRFFGYVSIGLPIFTLYSAAVTQGYSILRKNKSIIENINLPFFSYVFRFIVEQYVRFLFSLIPFIIYLAYNFDILLDFSLYLPLGIICFVLLVAVISVFSMIISAFFPNLSEAINATMGIMFFATPVFWHPGDYSGVRGMLAIYNPLSHMIAVIREPLLGRAPSELSLYVSFGGLAAIGLIGWYLFAISRPWLVYRV